MKLQLASFTSQGTVDRVQVDGSELVLQVKTPLGVATIRISAAELAQLNGALQGQGSANAGT